jgi:hypothetical protein
VTTFAGSTHPGQKSSTASPDVTGDKQGDVGMINPGEYKIEPRGSTPVRPLGTPRPRAIRATSLASVTRTMMESSGRLNAELWLSEETISPTWRFIKGARTIQGLSAA